MRRISTAGSVGNSREPRQSEIRVSWSAMPLPVLVADDSPAARFVVVRDVRARGLDVVEEESVAGASGVDPSGIACALLDLELEDGTGTDIATSLRERRSDLPIAFFSSAETGDLLERARRMGPVFAKPDQLGLAVAWVVENAATPAPA